MKFLVDAQLPRRLAIWLNERGHDALHTLDLPAANQTTDAEVIALADREGRAVVTKDADFVIGFHLRGQPQRLLLVATGNVANDTLLTLFEQHLDLLIAWLETGQFVELSARAVTLYR